MEWYYILGAISYGIFILQFLISLFGPTDTDLDVDFDGNLVKYTPKDFAKIKHGFIISIHKSQGSEFEMVIMPMTHSYRRMLYKKLVYTGVTRAKRKLILIGEPDAFALSVQNNHEYIRNSKLLEKIKYKFEKNT